MSGRSTSVWQHACANAFEVRDMTDIQTLPAVASMPCFRPFFDIAVVAEVPALSILQTIESIAALRRSAPVIYSFNTEPRQPRPILIGCTEARMGAGYTYRENIPKGGLWSTRTRRGSITGSSGSKMSCQTLAPDLFGGFGSRLLAGSVSRRGSSLSLLAYSVFSPFWGSGCCRLVSCCLFKTSRF